MAEYDDPINPKPLILSKLAWDLLDHDEVREWLPRLGLVPAGDDSLEMDHAACHERAQLLRPLVHAITVYSDLLAEIHAVYVIHEAGDTIPAAEQKAAREQYERGAQRLIQTSALSMIGEMLQEGILSYGEALRSRYVR